jgi:hypothetical protein
LLPVNRVSKMQDVSIGASGDSGFQPNGRMRLHDQ